MANPNEHGHDLSRGGSLAANSDEEEVIDLRDMFKRLRRGLSQTIGFALLGMAAAALLYLGASWYSPVSTSTRVVFSFPGLAREQYPDRSNFSPDDLRAPDVIAEAVKRQGLDTSSDFQSKIRAALNIEGIIPPEVVRDRDRTRAAGQSPEPYVPDEYAVTLTLPRRFSLSDQQRSLLVSGIVSAYRDKFERTYVDAPLAFGNVFDTLHDADFFEYEQILGDEVQNIIAYLNTFTAADGDQPAANTPSRRQDAASFRSPTTNLSFSDLLEQTKIFSQLRLNETLGLIHENGLSRDRKLALIKMNYYLQTLNDQEQKALADEKVIQDLLAQADRSQGYVLGIKSQATQPRGETPILDQGLIDSLLANDSYNFLVRKALDAGLEVKRIQAEKAQLLGQRANMESFAQGTQENQSALIAQVEASLGRLRTAYQELIANIRNTQADFARQQFANAINLSAGVGTAGLFRPLVLASAVGLFLGLAVGLGLSLLEMYVGRRKFEG